MIVSINQPAYLPWLGFFARIAKSDLFLVFDDAQFEKNSFTNRNRVKGPNGPVLLTVPVRQKGRFKNNAIECSQIDNTTDWRTKHAKTLITCYANAPFFSEYWPFFDNLFARRHEFLFDLCSEVNTKLMEVMGIATPVRRASQVSREGAKSDRVLALCRAVNATGYYAGALGKDYLDLPSFAEAGISVTFQNYATPVYPQKFGEFVPNLSAIDALFMVGPGIRALLEGGQDEIGVDAKK